MKTRTLSILTVVLALLACLYYFDYKRLVDLETADLERKRVIAAEPDAVRGLTIRNQHGQFTLERRADGAWWLTAPVDERADQKFVTNALLPALDAARKFGRFDASGAKPEDYGFGEQGIALTVRGEGVEPVRLSLGKETVIGGETYLRDDSEPDAAWVTGSDLFLALDKTLSDLRDKTVVPAEFDRVTRLSFSTSGAEDASVLSRPNTTGTWTVRDAFGREHPAEPKTAEQLFLSFQAMVLADQSTTPTVALAEDAAQHPEFVVSIEYLAENAELSSTTLRFRPAAPVSLPSGVIPTPDAEPDAERPYYATIVGRDLLFDVTPGLTRALADPVATLRDRRVFTLQTEDVAWFQVEAREDNSRSVTALERAAGGIWNFADGSSEPVNQVKTEQYLTFCLRQSVAAFEPDPAPADAADAGLDNPACRITVANADRSIREGLEVGRAVTEGGDRYYARRIPTGDTAAMPIFSVELPDPFLKVLSRTQRFFASRSVLRFDAEDVAQVQIEFLAETTTTAVLSRVEDGVSPWQGVFGDDEARALPENLVDLFLGALGSIEYLVVLPQVEPTIADQYGLNAPVFRLRLIGPGGKVIDGITFGRPPEDKNLLLIEDHFGKFMYVKPEALGSMEQSLGQVLVRLR